jgi:hypothetical protein
VGDFVPDLPWFVYAMLLAPLGLILVAAVYKTLQVRAASKWPSTPGKVVTSNSEVREVKVMDSDRESGHKFEERTFANIVSAQQPRQHRRGPRQLPGRGDHCEISRRRHRHRLLQSAASARSGAGARSAEGPVGLSRDWDCDRAAPSESGRSGPIMYERKVSYTYRFKGVAYTSVHASFSSNSKTTSRWVLRLFGMDFQDGASVKVWVNPDNPSEATLNPRVPFGWLLWAYLIATAG